MLRRLPLLLLVLTLGCKSAPKKTPEEQYAHNLAQQERELAKRRRVAEKEAKYQERLRTWHRDNQTSRSSWSEATGGKVEFGTTREPPRKPNDPRFDEPW